MFRGLISLLGMLDQVGAFVPARGTRVEGKVAATTEFAWFSPEVIADPYPTYRRLLEDERPTYVDGRDL